MTKTVTETCYCGSDRSTSETVEGLPLLRCRCGVVRQDVRLSEEELSTWYADRYFASGGAYYHSYDHDRGVAELRLADYALPEGSRILDVGCGNGAFVDAAREAGYDAWGQDLADEGRDDRTFVGELSAVAFPPGSFDVVTVHDVLEHVPDPMTFLSEIARILRFGGDLVLDFPRFWHESGRHHFKSIEHIWLLDEGNLRTLLAVTGFVVDRIYNPIESKIVVRASMMRRPSPTRILVPPGIGDGYWVLAKLRGFLDARGIYLPEVFVHDSGPRRSADFWSKVPFVRFGGYAKIDPGDAWTNAYERDGYPVQEDVQGFDFFISLNGTMDHGRSLDDALPGPTEWFEKIHFPIEHDGRVDDFRGAFGDYVPVAFWDRGFYAKWLADFPAAGILKVLRGIADTGRRVVVMGADWDRGRIASRLAGADPRFANLIGDTTFDELLALVDGADRVFGHPAGNTMLGPYLGVPTTLLWGNTFPDAFRRNALPPGANYFALDAKTSTVEEAKRAVLR